MLIMLIVVGALFGGIFFLKSKEASATRSAMASMRAPTVTVTTTEAKLEAWQPQVRGIGSLASVQGVDVTTEVGGLVSAVTFESGDEVKKDKLLVELVSDTDTALLEQLEAEAKLAHIVLERDKAQAEARAVSQATLDTDEANVKVREAQVKQQKALIRKKHIRAPFGGRLGITAIRPGQYLNPGEKIVTLQSLNPIYVDFHLPQQQLARLKVTQKVEVTTNVYPGKTFPGTITSINPKVDPDTRNFLVEATLKNPEHLLLPGMYASVTVQAGEARHLITLPRSAVSFNPYGDSVYVVEKKERAGAGAVQVAKQVFVKLGPTRGDQIAILDGVKTGNIVVTSGQLKLHNGSFVTINNKVQPSNNPSPKPEEH